MTEEEMKARFEELAPWHVNGTLAPAERTWVEEYAQRHAEARAELQWYEALQTQIHDNVAEVSDEIGWDRLQSRIRAERRQAQTKTSWLDSIREFVTGTLGGGQLALRPALAYAGVAVLVVQAGVIGSLLIDRDRDQAALEQWRSVQAQSSAIAGPVLRVAFKPDATEQDIRMLLLHTGATIVGGPGQLGNYILYVPAERFAAAQEALRNDSHVDNVDVLNTIPSKE